MSDGVELAEALNRDCDCVGTDVPAVRERLGDTLADTHAHLFSAAPVFVARAHLKRMRMLIAAVERVVALPGYQSRVLAGAPAIAIPEQAARGVFLGFDFHITADGPRLIEINTNAGGALLNAAVRGAQRVCCPAVEGFLRDSPAESVLEESIFAMFLEEWRRARGAAPLRRVAIVDDAPEQQYLYPEFLRFRRLFESRGVQASVCDARALTLVDDQLRHGDDVLDLVYNRSTDFYFTAPEHQALAQALTSGAAVVTPHPRAHALYANKRNLALLTDEVLLRDIGVPAEDIAVLLDAIPVTREVTGDGASWWQDRRRWFFKPASGYGSRGSYRGDKLTRRVHAQILDGEYVAQALTPAGERHHGTAEGSRAYKVDVRSYVYAGQLQQLAARLYQGQTTNFRTPGGGFAPVYLIPWSDDSRCGS
jgi:hypothetical protein